MADDLVRELSKPTKNRLYIVFLSSQFSYGMLWMGQFVSTAAGAQNQSHRKNLALLVTPMQATEKSDDIIGNGLSDYSFTFSMSVWLSFSSLLTPATVSGAPSCAVGGSRSKDRAGTVSRCALRRSLPPRFLRFFRDSIRVQWRSSFRAHVLDTNMQRPQMGESRRHPSKRSSCVRRSPMAAATSLNSRDRAKLQQTPVRSSGELRTAAFSLLSIQRRRHANELAEAFPCFRRQWQS
nr:F-box protein At1g47056-like isoform X1 [Ipomoea batatas]